MRLVGRILKINGIPGTKLLAKFKDGKLLVETNSYVEPKRIEFKLKKLASIYGSIFIKCTDTSGGEGIFKVNNDDVFNLENLSISKDYIRSEERRVGKECISAWLRYSDEKRSRRRVYVYAVCA